MYYLQSRYYDAEVGRFINCDDVNYIGVTESEISYNPFAYCENEPINCIDTFGKAKTYQSVSATNNNLNYIVNAAIILYYMKIAKFIESHISPIMYLLIDVL